MSNLQLPSFIQSLYGQIFRPSSTDFSSLAIDLFRWQAQHIAIYQSYIQTLGINIAEVQTIEQIPFLPIEFFKTHNVCIASKQYDKTFTSSGNIQSYHKVKDISVYEESFTLGFQLFYGNPQSYCILALLPSYLERQGSSLVYMMASLIKQSGNKYSGFYLYNYDELINTIAEIEKNEQPYLIFGVSYALLDLAEQYPIKLNQGIIMETGGMKGRRAEISRTELHRQLCKSFGANRIHSEYSMTELLSQAYSKGDGLFQCPPWMKIFIREIQDPFAYCPYGVVGGINIIDLANIYSCAFIETQDIGIAYPNGSFEVKGRMQNSDIRGCNLLID